MHTFFRGGFSAGEIFLGIIFHREGSFQGVNFSGEILHWGSFSELLHEILQILLDIKGNYPG